MQLKLPVPDFTSAVEEVRAPVVPVLLSLFLPPVMPYPSHSPPLHVSLPDCSPLCRN